MQYDSISRFAAQYDEIRINNLHTNYIDQQFINVIIMHIYLYIFEPVYHCLNQEQERSLRLSDNVHATSLV